MAISFAFSVFCQTTLEDHCFPRMQKLRDFLHDIKGNLPLNSAGSQSTKFTLSKFDVYAAAGQPLGEVPDDGYDRVIFVGMVTAEKKGDPNDDINITDPTSPEMVEFADFLKGIFSTAAYHNFPNPPDSSNPRDFSWVAFRVPANYDFENSVGPGSGK